MGGSLTGVWEWRPARSSAAPAERQDLSHTENRMGLGIVLLFWGIVGILLASAAAVVLASLVYFFDRRHRPVRRGWLLTAAALPFISLGYAAAGFAAYAVYCELVRDVDLGIGDSWRVPLGNGYRLVMIDTPDQAFIESPTGSQLHFGLARIGMAGDAIAGEDQHGLFVIDSRLQTEQVVTAESGLRRNLPSGAGQPQLVPPQDFYNHHRWGMQDVIAASVIIVPPLMLLFVLAWRFARSAHRTDH